MAILISTILSSVGSVLVIPFHLLLPPVTWLLSPLLVLLKFTAQMFLLVLYSPVTILSHLETMYIYCGSAAIIGVVAGSLIALLSHSLASVFGLLSPNLSTSRRHRKSKQTNIYTDHYLPADVSHPIMQPGFSTILEEEEEDSQVESVIKPRRRLAKRRAEMVKGGLDFWLDDTTTRSDGSSL